MSTPAAATFSRAPSVAGGVPRGVCEPAGRRCRADGGRGGGGLGCGAGRGVAARAAQAHAALGRRGPVALPPGGADRRRAARGRRRRRRAARVAARPARGAGRAAAAAARAAPDDGERRGGGLQPRAAAAPRLPRRAARHLPAQLLPQLAARHDGRAPPLPTPTLRWGCPGSRLLNDPFAPRDAR